MSEYTISKLDPGQFDLLLPLMKNCFGMDVDIDYFKWKFLDNPAGHFLGFIAVETETNQVAAYYGVIPEIYFIDREKTKIYQSCDTMTHSKHRRKGLFQQLATHCYDYLRQNNDLFVIGFSGEQSTPGFIKFGWRKVFDFERLFVPRALCYTARFANYPPTLFEDVVEYKRIEALIPRKESAAIYSFRDLEHFMWRMGNPQRNMKVIAFNGEVSLEGYVGYYVQNAKIFLLDAVFGSEKSQKALTNYLKRKVLTERLSGIVAFCQEKHAINKSLRRSGFLTNPFNSGPLHEKTPFIFYADSETMDRFRHPSNWSITSYDHDAS